MQLTSDKASQTSLIRSAYMMGNKLSCSFPWERAKSPPGAHPSPHWSQGTFPSWSSWPSGTGHTSVHSLAIPAARFRSGMPHSLLRMCRSLLLNCIREFNPLLLQTAPHTQARLAFWFEVKKTIVVTLQGAE